MIIFLCLFLGKTKNYAMKKSAETFKEKNKSDKTIGVLYCTEKLRYFKKATKIWKNLPLKFDATEKSKWKIFFKFCGPLRIFKLYVDVVIKSYAISP